MWILRHRPSAAMIVAVVALSVALCGSSVAEPAVTAVKRLVSGDKAIKKNSLSGNRLRKRTVRGDRLRANTLTGVQIRESGLGTVPKATAADSAASATTAGRADSAQTAQRAAVADDLAAPEPFHEVGASGEPEFQNACTNLGGSAETVGFYKDRQGVVHLKGVYTCPSPAIAFQLPAGYRPARGKQLSFVVPCGGSGCPSGATGTPAQLLLVAGSGISPSADGAVLMTNAPIVSLDGVTFRAAS